MVPAITTMSIFPAVAKPVKCFTCYHVNIKLVEVDFCLYPKP